MILTPELDYEKSEPIYMQLRNYVVDEMAAGRLMTNEKMPSVRQLAGYLGISRNSVENAYNQLLAEGYIESLERKGYFIADVGRITKPDLSLPIEEQSESGMKTVLYDFKSEYVSKSNFDYRLWKKHLNHVLNYHADKLFAYGETRGEVLIRESIANYFYRARGVVARADNIVIGGGVSPLLAILAKLFDILGINTIGMEDPGFNKAKSIFGYSHMTTDPISVDENGMSVKELGNSNARVCYVSPSHQYPTGYVMPVKNRQQLLKWAKDVDGYIIEDDYNSELRFEGRPIPAMQGMDADERVIYLGSFSTVLAPAIRVSFMVLPKVLNDLFEANIDLFSQGASKLEQLALSQLMDCGDFEKHIKRIRKNYSRKQQTVLRLIEMHLPPEAKPEYGKAGLHMTISLPSGVSEESIVESCNQKGVMVSGLGEYFIKEDSDRRQQLVLSYRGIEEEAMEVGIRLIGESICACVGYVQMGEGI